MLQIDTSILNWIATHLHAPIFDTIMVFITNLGDYGFIWILLTLFFLAVKKTRGYGVLMALSLIFALLISGVAIKPFVQRIRPFITHGMDILIPPPLGTSFPSSHAATSFAAATVIFCMDKRFGAIAYVLAFLIAFSRLYLYVHYPTDVLVGCLLGLVIGAVTVRVSKRIKLNIDRKKHRPD